MGPQVIEPSISLLAMAKLLKITDSERTREAYVQMETARSIGVFKDMIETSKDGGSEPVPWKIHCQLMIGGPRRITRTFRSFC